jgi:hypothetical protein
LNNCYIKNKNGEKNGEKWGQTTFFTAAASCLLAAIGRNWAEIGSEYSKNRVQRNWGLTPITPLVGEKHGLTPITCYVGLKTTL